MVTWPSAINTTLLSLRTHKTVVPCICAPCWLLCIQPLYNRGRWGQKRLLAIEGDYHGRELVVGLLFFFFFLLFFFGFAAADFLEALVERGFAEKIGRKIRIVFAGREED